MDGRVLAAGQVLADDLADEVVLLAGCVAGVGGVGRGGGYNGHASGKPGTGGDSLADRFAGSAAAWSSRADCGYPANGVQVKATMQVVYRASNLIEAHLAKHVLEGRDIPVFIFGESLLGGAGELPLFGILRVCVPEGFEQEALASLGDMENEQAGYGELGDLDGLPAA